MNNEGGKRPFEHLLSVLIIVTAVIALFVFINRISIPTERARIQYTLSNIRSAIYVRELTMLVTGESHRLERYSGANPIDLMDTPPAAYVGTYAEDEYLRVGRWYFDDEGGELVYRVINQEGFDDALELRFRVDYIPGEGDEKTIGRLRLVAVIDDRDETPPAKE